MGVRDLLLNCGFVLLELFGVACDEDKVCAGLGVEERGGGPDAGRAAGDEDDLVLVGLGVEVRLRVDQRVHTVKLEVSSRAMERGATR